MSEQEELAEELGLLNAGVFMKVRNDGG